MKQGVRLLLFAFIILLNACTGSQKTLTGEQAFDQKQYLVAAKLLEAEIAASKDEEEKAAKSLLIAQDMATPIKTRMRQNGQRKRMS